MVSLQAYVFYFMDLKALFRDEILGLHLTAKASITRGQKESTENPWAAVSRAGEWNGLACVSSAWASISPSWSGRFSIFSVPSTKAASSLWMMYRVPVMCQAGPSLTLPYLIPMTTPYGLGVLVFMKQWGRPGDAQIIYRIFTEHLLWAGLCAKCPGDKAVSGDAKVWIRPIWYHPQVMFETPRDTTLSLWSQLASSVTPPSLVLAPLCSTALLCCKGYISFSFRSLLFALALPGTGHEVAISPAVAASSVIPADATGMAH